MHLRVASTALLLMLSGCVAPAGTDSAEETAHAQLEAIWRLDADALTGTFDERFFDFGSDRWVDDPGAKLREYLESQEARGDMEGMGSWQDLVRLEDVVVGHPEDLGEDGAFFQSSSFESQQGDVVWFAPPAESSPLFDGWGGLYREVEGRWLMVGGD